MLDAIRWAGMRISPVTRSLEIKTSLLYKRSDGCLPLVCALRLLLPDKDDLSSLRSFSFDLEGESPSQADAPAIAAFQAWVLEQASHIEALRIPCKEPRYTAWAVRLKHIKHLEMDADVFAEGVSKAAKQHLFLETLHLHVSSEGNGKINVLECEHLRHMVLKSRCGKIRSVLHEPKCRLGIHVDVGGYTSLKPQGWAALQQSVEGANEFVYSLENYLPYGAPPIPWKDLRGHLTSVETLTLGWPVHRNVCEWKSNKGFADPEAEHMVKCCMPVTGKPMAALKVLIIRAEGDMKCCIPSGLLNLEELVLFAEGAAEVSFEDPKLTIFALKAFYIYGEPLRMHRKDELIILNVTASRDLQVSYVSARPECTGSCMYLRPITAPELPFQELHDTVRKLARQCRCKACFDCLRRARCLTWH